MSSKEIYVSISLQGKTYIVGRLWGHSRNGRQSASFEYDKNWLNNPEKFALEPALNLTEGTVHTPESHILFGSIGDSAPDRWGRVLMRRAETIRAKQTNETPRTLTEMDYLLGVNDFARQGALRFSSTPTAPYLKESDNNSIPPLIELPKLLSAAESFVKSSENAEELKLLLDPGSSLGGARPKASVIDKDKTLAIAKFPKKDDETNTVLWEAVALSLAKDAKINTPVWKVETILNKPILIIKRFDRKNKNRIPFLSAMSMLQAKDNEQHSYLEIAYSLAEYGAVPAEDIKELFRRVIFNILISNTDDHLRNHGFLYESKKGWRLSPVYDVNPTPAQIKEHILSTSIDFNSNQASLDTALSVAEEFRLSKEKAVLIIKEVANAVTSWRKTAKKFNLSDKEIEYMSYAFEHSEAAKAKNL
ncbi:MAG: type II toxin-antitoxin system HipA family toxin [Endomicrobium sp.]|jgi:serine/threonine-protein kinase HipA|nr:type II toxin-antitoxin system HipA family toxin [Endomicrobium sp.]